MAESGERIVEAVQGSDSTLVRAVGVPLRTLREALGYSSRDLAEKLGLDEAMILIVEERSDVHVSLLQRYVEGLGARLALVATFPDGDEIRASEELFSDENVENAQLKLPLEDEKRATRSASVVLSIRPIYCEKILNGEKKVELRRRFPADFIGGQNALIYSTSPTQALVGAAEISTVERLPINQIWSRYGSDACVDRVEFDAYFAGLQEGYALQLRKPARLKRTIPLLELRNRFEFTPPQSFAYVKESLQRVIAHDFTILPS